MPEPAKALLKFNTDMTKEPKKETGVTNKILVVDDDGQMGLVLDMILNESRFELDYVKDLLSADEYLKKQQPLAIVLDNKLPDGYGIDFIVYLKKKFPDIKVIMISGFGLARDAALANGADAFFEKPFSMDEFNDTLHKLLG
jgi:DNA-binding response OmpR family regulator